MTRQLYPRWISMRPGPKVQEGPAVARPRRTRVYGRNSRWYVGSRCRCRVRRLGCGARRHGSPGLRRAAHDPGERHRAGSPLRATSKDVRSYDLRDATFAGPPMNADPVAIGQEQPARYTCVRGGTLVGQPSIADMWRGEVYNKYGGYGLSLDVVSHHESVVDGLRVDRLVDGSDRPATAPSFATPTSATSATTAWRPTTSRPGGSRTPSRRLLRRYLRRPVAASPKNPEPLVLDGVLMRLKPFPNNPVALQTIRLFKSENWANVIVRTRCSSPTRPPPGPNSSGRSRPRTSRSSGLVTGPFPASSPRV